MTPNPLFTTLAWRNLTAVYLRIAAGIAERRAKERTR